ncbi:MAG: GFA family protein [Actinoallomurus sp.]
MKASTNVRRRRESACMKLPLTGGCNCGAVRYEVTEPLVRASYCHCERCQRRTGAGASAQAHPASCSFRIVAGQEKLRMLKPPEGGGEKWFCSDCGSAMFGSNPNHPESIGIRMGTLDDDPGIRPTMRQ